MNRAALTRLRNRIDVLRCPVCRVVGRYVPEPQKPVGDDPFEHATEEERAEVSEILNAMHARQGNVPTECRGCGRPANPNTLIAHGTSDEVHRLHDLLSSLNERSEASPTARNSRT